VQTALPPGCLDIPEQVNITEHIVSRHVLLGRGDQVALRWAGRSLTFAELEALTDTVSASLRAAGAGRGDRIVLCSPNSLAYAAGVLGAMKAGVVPVLTGPETTPAALQRIVDATGAVMVLTDHAQLDKLWSCDGVGAVGEPVREDTLADEPAYMHYTADGRWRGPRAEWSRPCPEQGRPHHHRHRRHAVRHRGQRLRLGGQGRAGVG
jgi:acyl-CoA synthetase (AMP-forming)/AMP-acid ligase II